jgi:hypothetical protein
MISEANDGEFDIWMAKRISITRRRTSVNRAPVRDSWMVRASASHAGSLLRTDAHLSERLARLTRACKNLAPGSALLQRISGAPHSEWSIRNGLSTGVSVCEASFLSKSVIWRAASLMNRLVAGEIPPPSRRRGRTSGGSTARSRLTAPGERASRRRAN